MKHKKTSNLIMILVGCIVLLCACGRKKQYSNESKYNETYHMSENEDTVELFEKGYELPVDEIEKGEAYNDCKKVLEEVSDIVADNYKSDEQYIVLSEDIIHQMIDVIKENGYPVTASLPYCNMENYEKFEKFLYESLQGICGYLVSYEVHADGSVKREKYIFDGTDMYVLSANAFLDENKTPDIVYVCNTRLKNWKYTDKGWFCYEMCVPEYPEVTEVVDGSRMIRIKPMNEKYKEIAKMCVLPIGYQGNNILCSDWDIHHMQMLDYAAMFEYLYLMKYHENLDYDMYTDGIPKDIFEDLIMEYFFVTSGQIQEYAVFDSENRTYAWAGLSCLNYTPAYFGTSIPEVTKIKENDDGTVTLTVDAVCEMVLCDEAVITHELTIQFFEDGSFKYVGNKILNDGIIHIPIYQYRVEAD